ncbi:MAG: type II and III secretion system protein [Elusimicrobia bacterium]|jgi:pilus assembly protein CpaC|nr:type II and III secretion system protein [Elusimicrobiota bacterium]
MFKSFNRICLLLIGSVFISSYSYADDPMIAVSADVVEISGSLQKTNGFGWNETFDFAEKEIPGILKVGDFERKTQIATSLKLLETEGKAQLLSNPKIIVKNAQQANFTVGGEIPIPYSNNQGVGADFKKFGVILQVLPTVNPNKKDNVDIQIALEVSNPDYSKPVVVSNTTIPSMVTRQIQTEVEIKTGETIVIGGLKKSSRNVSIKRVPVLGSIPLIGALFTSKDVVEDQSSLFLFITFEIIK